MRRTSAATIPPASAPTAQNTNSDITARIRLDYPDFSLDLDLLLPGSGVTALFGPSGCGKTTFLRCMAGLEQAPLALIRVHDQLWQNSASQHFLPAYKRPIGYVFQEASLFAHLSVKRNLQYGMRRIAPEQRKIQWQQIIDLLGIGHLLERMPDKLSGGERQRAAIARALLTSPRLLLMDEPLAALDMARKQEILPYLQRLRDELNIPVLYVSHALDEIARIADHVVVLQQGRAIAQGALQDIMTRPDLLPLAPQDHAGVVIEATLGAHDTHYHLSRLDFAGGSVLVSQRSEPLGHRLRFRILAKDVSLTLAHPQDSSISNIWSAEVIQTTPTESPAHIMVHLNIQQTSLLARITTRSADQLAIRPGQRLWAQVKSVALLE